jgi:uncharacterized protein (DUF2384 family)
MPLGQQAHAAEPRSDGAVLTRAALRAAGHLRVPQSVLARVLGVSEATVSRMAAGTVTLAPTEKAFELAMLFVRLFRALDAMVGGDEPVARAWMRNPNTVLGDAPITLIQSITGLVDVVAYLDARRARV